MLEGGSRGCRYDPSGYSYYLRGRVTWYAAQRLHHRGRRRAGDPRPGEGIGPAIRSGLRAAQAIVAGEPYRL